MKFLLNLFRSRRNLLVIFLTIVVSAAIVNYITPIQDITTRVNLGETVFSKTLTPSPILLSLLKQENIQFNDYTDILKQTQSKWLRQANTERWDIKDSKTHKYDKYFKELGMVNPLYPTTKKYTYVAILGATAPTMITRMDFLKFLIEKKFISFEQLVILTGTRKLNPLADKKKINNAFYLKKISSFKTETEVAIFLSEQIFVKTNVINQANINIISAIKYTGSRPNTGDTVKAWLKQNPKSGTILAISNQPYIGRQHAVLQYLLPKEFEVETVGATSSKDITDKLYLDSLARWIYQLVRSQQTLS